ncbi:MAG: hypothetical protein WHU94_12380 [Thermogemmata sp.]|jgi:hypothetical protein|uniref:Uncharacterized protein n=1 Tax=Thermogemmata fonticola TaxID=2755323 RepID=A0A7V8VCW5_9BACT|nr:hypothetical protein [Thermogemmata fonticola]MBA2225641.1 hypothetical protein [Thermogemmata fonticola]MCX8140414.1 hypothetical protein [Gemmataceae bacterium]
MAKKRRGPSRLDLRRQYEALEASGQEDDDELDEEADEAEDLDEDIDDLDDEDLEDEDLEDEEEAEEEEFEDEDEVPKKKKKKKKAKAAPKPAAKRPAREERRRAVWVIFDNTNKRVETFPFQQRAAAEAALARRLEEKKGHYYLNLVKDPIGE